MEKFVIKGDYFTVKTELEKIAGKYKGMTVAEFIRCKKNFAFMMKQLEQSLEEK